MKKSAFTLIELLVVIAIIALLAGIALPVYGKVQEKAKATNDGNNLRQIGLGIAAYLADNDDQIFKNPPDSGSLPWPQVLQAKYVTSWNTFKSPFDKRDAGNQTSVATIPVSYGVNVNILTQAARPAWDGNWSRLASPSQLVLMAPVMDPTKLSEPTFTGLASAGVVLPEPTTAGKLGTHGGRVQINVLYADTHVSTLRYMPASDTEAFSNITGETGLKRWKPMGK